ncbi:hypothetical protein J2X36_003943 [Methylobacterium sp. BE186]|uniref:hypothetical protein n=1 Tax=Methylobacterium sp. BE186 TaxID=2817715 RepID=UPI00285D6B20|nr:hypothetical protein [Methylobacterium sp. BE186]MDR7039170.1 hypothetical protein [Methylobacterium sp. BE186]
MKATRGRSDSASHAEGSPSKKSNSLKANRAGAARASTQTPATTGRKIRVKNVELTCTEDVTRAVSASRETLISLQAASREGLRCELANACGIAIYLRSNELQWLAFLERNEIDSAEARKPQQAEALRCVLSCIVPGRGKQQKKRVSKYFKALNPFVEAEADINEIPQLIKDAGGIERLARKEAKKKGKTKTLKHAAEPIPDETESVFFKYQPSADFLADLRDDIDYREPGHILEISLTEKQLGRIMGIEPGQKARVTFVRIAERGSWKKYSATKIRLL